MIRDITHLIAHAAELFNLTPDEITTPSKTWDGIIARQAIAFVAHKQGVLRKIVAYDLGQREYSTIANAQRRARIRIQNDPDFRGKVWLLMWGKKAQLDLFQRRAA